MRVSIVTISYNQARFLEQALLSVLQQDYPEVEYVVVDPGSTDESRDIINRYRHEIDHVVFEPDDGPADGLNKGFSKASGEIFGFLNADDVLHPHAVSQFVSAFAQSDAGVISSHGYRIDSTGRVVGRVFSDRFDPVAYVYGMCVLVQQSTFFRAGLFREAGGFNPRNRLNWDGELWFEMAAHGGRFGRIPGYWSYFRDHADSISRSRPFQAEAKANLARLGTKIGIRDTTSLLKRCWLWLRMKPLDPIILITKLSSRLGWSGSSQP